MRYTYILLIVILVFGCKKYNDNNTMVTELRSSTNKNFQDTILIIYENSDQFERSNNLIIQLVDKLDHKKIKCQKEITSTSPFETIRVLNTLNNNDLEIGFIFNSVKLYDGEYFELSFNYIESCMLYSISLEIAYEEERNNIKEIVQNSQKELHQLLLSDTKKNILNTYIQHFLKKGSYKYTWIENNLDDINNNLTTQNNVSWKGIYWYFPFETKDSLGSYYIDIQDDYSDFGFSGHDSYKFEIYTKTYADSVILFKIDKSIPFGTIYKNNNNFWIKSDSIKIKKHEDLKKELIPLKHAKSSDEIED